MFQKNYKFQAIFYFLGQAKQDKTFSWNSMLPFLSLSTFPNHQLSFDTQDLVVYTLPILNPASRKYYQPIMVCFIINEIEY